MATQHLIDRLSKIQTEQGHALPLLIDGPQDLFLDIDDVSVAFGPKGISVVLHPEEGQPA